ncbi:hypothetical protein V1264_002833 [Littorina saxatilis]|uniref:Sulfatase N-terminal domain-containing protein n=1 Tax=Littorina saxatilis TaxID=31220 RepID=A0AAN9B4S9_9CAEN
MLPALLKQAGYQTHIVGKYVTSPCCLHCSNRLATRHTLWASKSLHHAACTAQTGWLPDTHCGQVSHFTMLPALLKQAGYQTHIVGKWHLGMCNWEYTPTYRGFDSFYGYYNAYEDYYTHAANGGYDFRDDTSVFRDPSNEYFNYLLTERTVQLVEKLDTSTPLFLYLPYHLCHGPLQVPAKYENMYSDIQNSSRRIYCGMVSMMDESFGNITQALDSRGLLDNTLLVFTTDNGGPVQYGANNWPLRGGKGTFWEGGTRGVAFVWSKNLLSRTGYTNNEMMHAVDWYPTILHMAGLQPGSSIDGVNQWDMLSNNGPSQRDEFVYNIDTIPNSTAIRYKDYKLLTGNPGQFNDWYPVPQSVSSANLTSTDTQGRVEWKPQLYNIRNDPEERHDLAESDHQTLQMMLGRLQDWIKSGVTPQNAQVDPRGDPKRWGGVWTPGWC